MLSEGVLVHVPRESEGTKYSVVRIATKRHLRLYQPRPGRAKQKMKTRQKVEERYGSLHHEERIREN